MSRMKPFFRTILPIIVSILGCIVSLTFAPHAQAAEKVSVTTIDFLKDSGQTINGAGPVLVKMDAERNRIIVANTLSSSLSIIDGKSHAVENVALGGRALQHLKEEAMFISPKTGNVYLIGAKCFSIVFPDKKMARTIPTDVQFETVVVNDSTGNIFLAGRESASLGFIRAGSEKIELLPWLERREDLINLNMTPPPSIRKLVMDQAQNQLIAVDGYTSTLYLFDARTGKKLRSRLLKLTGGGRWHLAGYDEKSRLLFLVTETDKREIIEAGRIDIEKGDDLIIQLPKFTEGVGIRYNPKRNEVYIPYDNHPSVHVVDFNRGGAIEEIKIPAYGNDASAIDLQNDTLYIGSWAHGEIDVIDLQSRKLQKRILELGIIPHMFTIAFNPNNGLIYFPKGATAVNGTFGAAISALDPATEKVKKIHTGWAPIDLIELKERNSFLVFNSEDRIAEVRKDGKYDLHNLPFDYPVRAAYSPEGNVYLSYGPHQSYWPVVYIWDAKNGILTIGGKDLSFYDRRIPRQSHRMALDARGILYLTQNNWGKEEQFLGILKDEVRLFEPGERLALKDEVEREITQRILEYDPELDRLYLVRIAEKDSDPSLLQIISPSEKRTVIEMPLGLTATDLVFDGENLYISNFDSNSVSVVNRRTFETVDVSTEKNPLRLCNLGDRVYVLNHRGNSLQEIRAKGKNAEIGASYPIPFEGLPDNIFPWKGKLIITSHNSTTLSIIAFDPVKGSFTSIHRADYPYGDTSFDSRNVSFYVRGQFGDVLFSITQAKEGDDGRLWITDFLSGKLFILESR